MIRQGWMRYGVSWAAHYYVDGTHLCPTQHDFAEGAIARGMALPKEPVPVELTPHCVPYGRACQRCLKLVKAMRRAA